MLGRTKSTLSALSSNTAQEESESDKNRRRTTTAVFADILRQVWFEFLQIFNLDR
jgi:hypothetical protein